jgi:drug/metabolite transporter (DMT)-like permease
MPPIVLGLLAVAAVLHALWNVLLKGSEDPLATGSRAMGWGLLVATPLAAGTWWVSGQPAIPPQVWALAGASAVAELLYFIFLSAAYRRGDLSTVYPIARGTAPLIAVAIGLVVLGERLQPAGYAGIALLIGGIWLVRRPTGSGSAVGFALLTGIAIATYSAIDRVGVQALSPWLYGWAVWTFTFVLLQLWVRGSGILWRRDPRPSVATRATVGDSPSALSEPRRAAVIGVALIGAWLLVLTALSLAPLAVVVPLRESAVVLVTGWGMLRMGEREGARLRLVGAAAIVVGVVSLALA